MTSVVESAQSEAVARFPSVSLALAKRSPLTDAAIIVVGLLLAMALRLPYLHDVPRYTDELREVQVALSIARGEAFPLTNYDAYMGAFYNYILAGAFLVFGEHPHVPRLLIALSSAATVPLVYLFGREIGGRAIGLVAAVLLAGNAQHIANGSHVAYSHSLTPAVSALALWLLWRALYNGPSWTLLVGAFAFGLALQTHPTAIVLAPGIAAAFLLQGRRWLRGRWPFLAVGADMLGYANVIAYNIGNIGAGFAAGLAMREGYAEGKSLGLDAYPSRLLSGVQIFRQLFEVSVWNDTPVPWWVQTLLFQTALFAFLLGLIVLLLRRQYLVPFVLIGCILTLPVLAAYRVELHRYWMLALPPATITMAVGIMSAARWAASLGHARLAYLLAGLLVVALSTYSLPGLWKMYQVRGQVGPTNNEMERLAALIQDATRPGESVLVDQLVFPKPKLDETREEQTLYHLLRFHRVPVSLVMHGSYYIRESLDRHPGQSHLLVAPADFEPTVRRIRHAYPDLRSPSKELGLAVSLLHISADVPTFQPPGSLQYPTDVVFGGRIRLLGYDLDQETLRCGDRLYVRLYWQLTAPVDVNYQVFTHLVAGDRGLAQHDGPPRDGLRPTTSWQPGEVVDDEYRLALDNPCDAPRSVARIRVGLYDLATMRRLPVTNASTPAGPDFVMLPTEIAVEP